MEEIVEAVHSKHADGGKHTPPFFFYKRLFLHILCVQIPNYDWYFHFHTSLTVSPAWRSFHFDLFHLPPAGPSQRLLDRSAVGEEREVGGEEEGEFDRSLPGSHAFVIKLLILCCAGNAPPCTFANFCIFFSSGWPLSLPAVPSHINPILLHFGHSTNRWCFLSTRLPNSSNLSYLCLFL